MTMEKVFLSCFTAGLKGSLLIIAAVILRICFRQVPASCRRLLWLVIMFRLLIPFSIPAAYALFPPDDVFFPDDIRTGLINRTADVAVTSGANEIIDAPKRVDIDQDEINGIKEEVHTPETAQAPEIKENRSPQHLGMIIWISGTLGMLFFLLANAARLQSRIRFAIPAHGLSDEMADMAFSTGKHHLQGLSVIKGIYYLDDIASPFVLGIVRPCIYFPFDIQRESIPHVLGHEITHIRCMDHIWKPLFFLALSLHWYNPFVWIAFLLFIRDIEEACDDRVIAGYDSAARKDYAEALMSVVNPKGNLQVFPVAFMEPPIRARVRHVLSYKAPGKGIRILFGIICAALILCFMTAGKNDDVKAPGDAPAALEDTVGTGYPLMISEHYKLCPDDEDMGYVVYDRAGRALTGLNYYNDPLVIADELTGEKRLYSWYKDFNAYQVMPVDDELEKAFIQAIGEKLWYIRNSSDYETVKDEASGLSYMVKTGHPIEEGHVLLHDEKERKIYDDLAALYGKQYIDLLLAMDAGYIYADLEIKGLCFRFPEGFLSLQSGATGSIQYIDHEGAGRRAWSLWLTQEENGRLRAWIRNHPNLTEEMTRFESWEKIFDELNIQYRLGDDRETPRLQAAKAELEQIWGEFPPKELNEETAERELLNHMKRFDEDGDSINVYGIAGMDATGKDISEWHIIIDIPEEYRQLMFDTKKEEFLRNYGMSRSDDTKRSEVFREYQKAAPKQDRLSGTWTLGQYERIYDQVFIDTVLKAYPEWESGDIFPEDILDDLTRAGIDAGIRSDGANLSLMY